MVQVYPIKIWLIWVIIYLSNNIIHTWTRWSRIFQDTCTAGLFFKNTELIGSSPTCSDCSVCDMWQLGKSHTEELRRSFNNTHLVDCAAMIFVNGARECYYEHRVTLNDLLTLTVVRAFRSFASGVAGLSMYHVTGALFAPFVSLYHYLQKAFYFAWNGLEGIYFVTLPVITYHISVC